MFEKFGGDIMKIRNEYQKNFGAISETVRRKFWKNFVKC